MDRGWILFFAIFLGVAAVGLFFYFKLRRKVRDFSETAFGTPDLIAGLKSVETEAETTPRSLSGCDSILLPQILRDFPDFDVNLAKNYGTDALRAHLSQKEGLRIHNIVLSRYLRTLSQKTILMQAAAEYQENGRTVQKRYDLSYSYVLQGQGGSPEAAASCPHCGGVIGFGQTECPYGGSRLAVAMLGAWEFTQIQES